MGKELSYKRISLRINKSLYTQLNAAASKLGVPKSKVLKGWLERDSAIFVNQALTSSNTHKTIPFNFRLPTKSTGRLKEKAHNCGLSVTSYIEIIIANNVVTALSSKTLVLQQQKSTNYKTLYANADLDLISETGEASFFAASDEEKFAILLALVEMGEFGKAKNFLAYFEICKVQSEGEYVRHQAIVFLIKGIIEKCSCQFDNADKLLRSAQQFAELAQDRYLKALSYLSYARLVYQMTDAALETKRYLYLALELFDVMNHPLEVAQVYSMLAYCWDYSLDYARAEDYYARAKNILNRYPNSHHWVSYYRMQGHHYYYANRDISRAHTAIATATKLLARHPLWTEQIECIETAAKVYLYSNEVAKAYATISAKEPVLKTLLPAYQSSMTHIYKLFVASKDNYSQALQTMQKTIAQDVIEYRASQRCVQAAAQYLHADSSEERVLGEKSLKRLIQEYSHSIISHVSQTTLETRMFKGIG
jgi:predicted DNA binding CopG/RHH family protein